MVIVLTSQDQSHVGVCCVKSFVSLLI